MKRFSKVSVLGVHAGNGSFQNVLVSNLSVFICALKTSVFTTEQCGRQTKTGKCEKGPSNEFYKTNSVEWKPIE